MKKNNGIALIKLLIIILVIILLISLVGLNFLTDISQSIDIFYKTISKQINLKEEIVENEILLGITDVKGEGIIINILDGKDLIHQEDLIILIDELKNSGSQAISINGQRITNMTDIMDISNTYVLVNSILISAPYIIHAIGDIDKMEEALYYNNSHYNKIKEKGNQIELYKIYNLTIDKYVQKKDKDKMLIDYLK